MIVTILKKIGARIKKDINCFLRRLFILPEKRKNLKNRDFTIIASDCIGCLVSHDLGVRFNSPTVNLYMTAGDYLKFVADLKRYMNEELVEVQQDVFPYPVGLLGGEIVIYFQHYKTFANASKKWHERCKRVNYNNLFFIMTDRNECSDEKIIEFGQLPYQNKLIFTAKKYPEVEAAVYCREYSGKECVGVMSDFSGINGERNYDKYFDFVSWLNEGR